jgi:trafficking protein particle complex subunit 2
MTLISLAIVGKNNQPIFLKEFRDQSSTGLPTSLTITDIPEAELFGLETATSAAMGRVPPTNSTSNANALTSSGGTDGFSSRARDCSLRHQFLLHAALDRLEELSGPPPGWAWREPGAQGIDAMWVGLLTPVEGFRVYGYMTSTNIKILGAMDDSLSLRPLQAKIVEDELKKLFVHVHEFIVEYKMNPFHAVEDHTISSPFFDAKISDAVEKFNQLV